MASVSPRKSVGGALRVKELNVVENSNNDAVIKLESSSDLLNFHSPSLHKFKRQRSSIGVATRVRTSYLDNQSEKENITASTSDTVACDDHSNTNNSVDFISRRQSTCSSNSRTSISDEESTDINSWSVKDFSLSKPIGKGKFGNVYMGKERRTKTQVALKVLFKAPMQAANCVHTLRREVEIHCRLKHRNIVQLHG
jgi:hypothetical protein